MRKSIVFMFSGQGSQFYRMGEELYQQHQTFRNTMDQLDRLAREMIGESVLERIYDSGKRKSDPFERTLYTHPAIFMVEYAMAQVMLEKGIEPDFVMGASLGEYAACAVAGIMRLEDLMECLIKQAQWLEMNCQNGGMLAILSSPRFYDETPLLREKSELASVNYASHFVVAGKSDNLNQIQEFLREQNITSQVLPVSHAFHSSLIDPIESQFTELLRSKVQQKPKIPLISCAAGGVVKEVSPDDLWHAVRQPILFARTIAELEQQQNLNYLDLGPSGTFANFVKQNLTEASTSSSYSFLTPFNQELKRLEAVNELCSRPTSLQEEVQTKKMKAYVFPGQGSQSKGMGESLFDEFPELTAEADEILGYSIKDLCLEDPSEKLVQTQYTQPALYVVSTLSYLKKVQETGQVPDYVAGHSLGEYVALFAAGAFDFATGLKMVKKRGELMAQATGGGMAAVVGMSAEKIQETMQANGFEMLGVANFNSPSQIVITGPKEDILRAGPVFDEAGARVYIPLKVGGAFHSRYMQPSKEQFAQFIANFQFERLKIPVISNVYARRYDDADISKNLVDQITHSVKWTETIQYLIALGVEEIEEVGPGKALTGMVAKIRKEAEPLVLTEHEKHASFEMAHLEVAVTTGAVVDARKDAGTTLMITTAEAQVTLPAFTETLQEVQNLQIEVMAPGAASLGDEEFMRDYQVRLAYLVGSMHKGISSPELVVRLGNAGLMGYFGSSDLSMIQVEEAIRYIQQELRKGESYGMNLTYSSQDPGWEDGIVDLYIRYNVPKVEVSSYLSITPALIKLRLHGLKRGADRNVSITNRILAKVSRPEVAQLFVSPAPELIVQRMVDSKQITPAEAELLKKVPMADDLCVVADGGGQTDQGVAYALMPVMRKLRDDAMARHGYAKRITVGAAGGIGTPDAAAAAFVLGADFVMTGSINQCTVEANTSETVKELLNEINVQDTTVAPAEDMFEMGAKVQVLKRGVFFPARANKLYNLFHQYNSWQEIDEKTKRQLQEKYFQRSFEEVYAELTATLPADEIAKASQNPKLKMALVFKWYLRQATQYAQSGVADRKVDYQIYCGSALGAFNQWAKGTRYENWRNRHVDEIAVLLMEETYTLLQQRFQALVKTF